MYVSATVVASLAHAILASFVAVALVRRGRSWPARKLALSFTWLVLHSSTLGLGYALRTQTRQVLFLLSLPCTFFAVRYLAEFAFSLSRASFGPRARLAGRTLRSLGTLTALLVTVASFEQATIRSERWPFVVLGGLSLCGFMAIFVALVAAQRRGVRLAGRMMLACALPLAPLLLNILFNLGVSLPFYRLVRDLSILGFCFAMLSAYLDGAEEPMSLHDRLLAGALTCVLATVIVACQLVVPHAADSVAAEASPIEVHRVASRMLLVCMLGTALVLVGFPLLVRANVIRPIDDLVRAVRGVEAGSRERVSVRSDDELGALAVAFNRMSDALELNQRALRERIEQLSRRNAQIARLGEDLREQLAERSRDLRRSAEAKADELSARARLSPGDRLDHRYQVLRPLGRGGMGEVIEVKRLRDGEHFALKLASRVTHSDVARFAREAEIACGVDHPNVVRVVDVGRLGVTPYLVMELVRGGSLEDARPRFGQVLWGLARLSEIAEALSAIHERGIVHRDLKPANVLLSEGSTLAKVADFGIATPGVDPLGHTALSGASRTLTHPDQWIGTLSYMAPEAAARSGAVGTAADMFAFGLIAHELLTGAAAFATPPLLDALAGRRLPPPPALPAEVSAEVRAVLAACLASEPTERPTAREVARLLRFCHGSRARLVEHGDASERM